MPTPKLPSYTPPSIPVRRTSSSESPAPKKGSSFFTTLLLALLLVWTFNLLTRHGDDKNKTPEDQPTVSETKTSAPLPVPTPEDSAKRLADLPEDAVKIAQADAKRTPEFLTLGSADPNSPYRMLVTLANRGAAVERIELNERAFRDCSDQSGYLGQIVADESLCELDALEGRRGVAVQVVGTGTPAALAGLQVGDRIVSVQRPNAPNGENESTPIVGFDVLREILLKTSPEETVKLGVIRRESAENKDALPETIDVGLTRAPISVVRPSGVVANYADLVKLAGLQGTAVALPDDLAKDNIGPESTVRKRNTDPSSFLLTLAACDGERLDWPTLHPSKKAVQSVPAIASLAAELPDLAIDSEGNWTATDGDLRDGIWEAVVEESNESKAVFRKVSAGRKLEFRKIYELAPGEKVADGKRKKSGKQEYHLTLTVEIRNLDAAKRSIAYALDGPTGLPVEGAWYSAGRKTGPGWGTYGLRDLVVGLDDGKIFDVIKCWDVAMETKKPTDPVDLDFLGVDSQYFQCSILPVKKDDGPWRGQYLPIRVGARIEGLPTFANTSFRLVSSDLDLAPAGQAGDKIAEQFTLFAGPKRQETLNAYGLGQTLVYGWFWFISKPLVWILHLFNSVVFNYGVAIFLLTVLVRLCLFPLSMKQVASTLKMQKIQPLINDLKKKYADNPQEMMRQQQALWKKYKINPLGGCLPLFLQMPIFIGLYKALAIDVNLYGAPLLTDAVRWCGNLAAPDRMIDWSQFWNHIGYPGFNLGQGMIALGPYFNLLPILSIILILVQQKLFMPPPTGTPEEIAQQKMMRFMMNFMMIFMGVMFFKVPSGLCVYFIATSLWALLERRLHPKFDLKELEAAAAKVGNGGVIDVESRAVSSEEDETIYGPTRGGSTKKRNRRQIGQPIEAPEKSKGLRAWWNNVLERAKEQQRLAKADAERRGRPTRRKRG